jgi:hypothetical protein
MVQAKLPNKQMKSILINITDEQHLKVFSLANKTGKPVKKMIEGFLTGVPVLSEQEKKELLRALKTKK